MKQTLLLALRVLLVLLAAPWVVLWAAIQVARYGFHGVRALRAGLVSTVTCPVGHAQNDLLSRWECRCGAVFLGHAFDPCPVCRLPAGWITCAKCGLAIVARDL